jgi:hypothetical protein
MLAAARPGVRPTLVFQAFGARVTVPQKPRSDLRTTFGARPAIIGYSKLEERLRRERDRKKDSLRILERGIKVLQRARRSFLE